MTFSGSGRAWDALRAAEAQDKLWESPEHGLDQLAKKQAASGRRDIMRAGLQASYNNPLNDG